MDESGKKIDRRKVLEGIAAVGAAAFLPKEGVAQQKPESIPLKGKELDRARYEYFRTMFSDRPVSGQKNVYKAYMYMKTPEGKPQLEETACVFLEENGNVRVQGKSFEFTLSPDGVISGSIPPVLEEFLQLEKRRSPSGEEYVMNRDFETRGAQMTANYVETCDPLVS